ncbi:MAG: hypothetical protein H0U13_09910 [Gemmatimonadaceae bacterium]|nr:hypothetical protein [Gemmatimonadaceae bacterium]
MTRRRREPNSWTTLRLPEGGLATCILDLATPLFAALGAEPTPEQTRGAIEIAVAFWNASVEGSEQWEHRNLKPLREVKKCLGTARAPDTKVSMFDALAQRWRATSRFDPRLVASWSYDVVDDQPRLICEVTLPEGVRAEVPPPAEKRISIGGAFLDEVRIRQTATSLTGYPVDNHRGWIGGDGTATVEASMPTALQLLADGRLPRIGGEPVDLVVCGRHLPSMVLSQIRCGEAYGHNVKAVLLFKPSAASSTEEKRG